MKVILIAAISKLGKIGDVVEVKNGFAKNFLIPSKKAICFTANNYKVFESKKHEFEQAHAQSLEGAAKVKAQLEGKDVVIIENASDDGRLYGSVNSSVIAAKINAIIGGKNVARADIFLSKPIKEIGVYKVKLNASSEAEFEVRLIVTRSESEIEALLKGAKKGEKKSEADEGAEVVAAEAESTEEKPAKAKRAPRKKAEAKTEEAA